MSACVLVCLLAYAQLISPPSHGSGPRAWGVMLPIVLGPPTPINIHRHTTDTPAGQPSVDSSLFRPYSQANLGCIRWTSWPSAQAVGRSPHHPQGGYLWGPPLGTEMMPVSLSEGEIPASHLLVCDVENHNLNPTCQVFLYAETDSYRIRIYRCQHLVSDSSSPTPREDTGTMVMRSLLLLLPKS